VNSQLDYVTHLTTESARFGEAIASAPSDAAVPTCPDWTADDLLWHLGWVQSWWAVIVRDKLTGPQARELMPDRPADRPGLLEYYRQAGHRLADVLRAVPAETEAWTWSNDQTVGFIRRKQAHEALIHRVDAEVTAGRRTPMDRALSADGVDEALRVMYSGVPDWGRFEADPARTLRIRATDTGDSWVVRLGRFTGTDPDGVSYDEPDFDVLAADAGVRTLAVLSGTAADLDCRLWHRPPTGEIGRSGDEDVLSAFEEIIAPGIG
jgi:uncharacterized protein (TIGR03083 family)